MFLWIEVSTFCYATESLIKVSSAISILAPGVELSEERKSGYHAVPIVMLSTRMTDGSEMDLFFERLGTDVIRELLRTIEARVDDERVLHFRLDKQSLVLGKPMLANHGDSIVIKCKLKSMTGSSAIEDLRSFFGKSGVHPIAPNI